MGYFIAENCTSAEATTMFMTFPTGWTTAVGNGWRNRAISIKKCYIQDAIAAERNDANRDERLAELIADKLSAKLAKLLK